MLILQVEWVQNWQKANKPSVRQRSSRQFSGPSLVVDDRTSQFLFHDVRLRFSWQTGQCHHLLSMFHFVNRCFCTTREKLPLESECWTQIVVFLNRGPMFTCFQTFRNYQKLLSQSSGLLQLHDYDCQSYVHLQFFFVYEITENSYGDETFCWILSSP